MIIPRGPKYLNKIAKHVAKKMEVIWFENFLFTKVQKHSN